MFELTRLQELAGEFMMADEALRKSMLREEALRAKLKRWSQLMQPKRPKQIEVIGRNGDKQIWSLPIR
jgi:hypothetical protein